MPSYLSQRAAPWVSMTVMVSGAIITVLLFWLVSTDNSHVEAFDATGGVDSSVWSE
jgi:hypothetical protein